MSLFTGNVVNESGAPIDCSFQFYFYDIDKISNIRSTELTQFNIDSDDEDVSNQTTAFSAGSIGILYLYTETECAVVRITSDGSDSYVFNVQLRACQAPSVTLIPSNSTIGSEVTVNSTSSDEYQWIYEGTTHYHKNSWYGKTWCDIGIVLTEYDFGEGYSTSNKYTYTITGDQTVSVRVTNRCGLTAIDSDIVEIRYNAPYVDLSNAPTSVIVGQDTTITIDTTDIDSRVTSQVWYMDDVITDTTIHSFNEVGTHIFKVVTYWNDGYSDLSFEDTLVLSMTNQPPTIDMEVTEVDGKYNFISNAVDPEDSLSHVEVVVYVDSNTILMAEPIDTRWSKIDTSDVPLDAQLEFYMPGKYKVTMQAFDTAGLSSTIAEYEVVIDIAADCPECPECPDNTNPAGNEVAATKLVNIGSLVSGDVELLAVSGDIELMNVSGDIELVDAYGDIEPMDVNGDVEILEVEGNLT